VDFGQPFGSEPGYRRPALLVQSDPFNQSAIQTVILIPLTKSRELAPAPAGRKGGRR
jgi:mRNA interferase MazF